MSPILKGDQILLIFVASTVNKTEPIAVFLVTCINDVGHKSILNYLKMKKEKKNRDKRNIENDLSIKSKAFFDT